MTANSFDNLLPLDQMMQEQQRIRQENFESQALERVLRSAGVLSARLERPRKESAGSLYTADWFNRMAGFPVKLSVIRFSARRKYDRLARSFRLGNDFGRAPEMLALADVADGYPGEPVALISRYSDFRADLVFHALEVRLQEGQFWIQKSYEGKVYTLEVLPDFVRRFAGQWQPFGGRMDE